MIQINFLKRYRFFKEYVAINFTELFLEGIVDVDK